MAMQQPKYNFNSVVKYDSYFATRREDNQNEFLVQRCHFLHASMQGGSDDLKVDPLTLNLLLFDYIVGVEEKNMWH
jgi:hypothetical protein